MANAALDKRLAVEKLTIRSDAQAKTWPSIDTRPMILLILLGITLGLFLLNVTTGSVDIPLGQVVKIIAGLDAEKRTWEIIVMKFRLPKAITASLAGAALAVAGLQMQTLFRNPLADPFVLGINSGASLGVALVVLSAGSAGIGAALVNGLDLRGDIGLAIAASLGAGVVLALVMAVARRVHSTMTLLILGLMFSYITGSLVSLLMYFAITERIQAFINWGFGSFSTVTWGQMQVFAPVVVIGLVLALALAKQLNALLLGEVYARSMGMNVRRVRLGIIVSGAMLAGVVTAFCGPIAFIGVAVPHLTRAILGTSDHRVTLPANILMGASLALIADLVAQMPGSQTVLPLNAVTALIGAPVVAWVILRQRNMRGAFGG